MYAIRSYYVLYRSFHGIDNMRRRGGVRVTDAEVDQVNTFCRCLLLHLVDRGKKIGSYNFV